MTKQVEPGAAENAKIRVESPEGTYVPSNSINSKSVKLPDPANPFDF